MRHITKILVLLVIGAALLVPSTEAQGRKKSAGAYISGAKIEIVSGDLDRYETAIHLLDTLMMYYGPHAEALFWLDQVMVDYIGRVGTFEKKREYLENFKLYVDSLHWTCENKDIDKDNRKNCDEYIQKSDSTLVKFWREYYNSGVGQLQQIRGTVEDMEGETDSAALAYFTERLAALEDSAEFNLNAAILLDSSRGEPYIAMSQVFSNQNNYEKANEWLILAKDKVEDPAPLNQQIAYNYVEMDDYCTGAPFLREYIDQIEITNDNAADALQIMYNLTIMYNRCEEYRKADTIYHRILTYDRTNAAALMGIGRFHNEMARKAADSIKHYREVENEERVKVWTERRDERFDSSMFYLNQAFEAHPEDMRAAEELAIVAYVRGNYELAAQAFARAVELNPEDAENWTSLGDAYINLKKFEDAATAYEKVLELDPDNKGVMESLVELYLETGESAKRQEMQKKIENL